MRREVLVAVVVVVLLVAAGGFLAAASVGGGSDEKTATEALPFEEREPDRILDRLLPELEPLLSGMGRQPFVGIALSERDGDVLVERVVAGSPAAQAGIHEGDIIEAVDDTPVHDFAEVAEIVRGSERGDVLAFRVRRDGEEHEIEVQVGLRPLSLEPDGDVLRSLLPPEGFLEFFAFSGLRERLSERFERLIEGRITFLNDDGERVSLRFVAGTLAEASDDEIVVSPNGGGSPQEFTITEQTYIVRSLRPADANELETGDRVIVVALDEGKEASALLAFPAHEERAES